MSARSALRSRSARLKAKTYDPPSTPSISSRKRISRTPSFITYPCQCSNFSQYRVSFVSILQRNRLALWLVRLGRHIRVWVQRQLDLELSHLGLGGSVFVCDDEVHVG